MDESDTVLLCVEIARVHEAMCDGELSQHVLADNFESLYEALELMTDIVTRAQIEKARGHGTSKKH